MDRNTELNIGENIKLLKNTKQEILSELLIYQFEKVKKHMNEEGLTLKKILDNK